MAKAIVKESQAVVTEDDLIALKHILWKAQSLCRLLYEHAGNIEDSKENPAPTGQLQQDIKNTAEIIESLIGQAHDVTNDLEETAIRGSKLAEVEHG